MRFEAARSLKAILAWSALALLIGGSMPAAAQYGPGPTGRAPYSYQPPGRNEAGNFAYYSLILSWSPTYCASAGRERSDPQCDLSDGRHYAFVLHGLWPQHERGWPESCRTQERPYVPRSTINRMLDIMPSPRLVIHEYRKHGTCSGLPPNAYFDLARKLYAKVKVPPRYERPNRAFFVSPAELRDELVAANPGLKPDMLAVACGGPGGRLREVRICFSRDGEFRSCGRNEEQRRLCSQARMYVPPVRPEGPTGRGADENGDAQPPGRSPLPGPLDPAPPRSERRI
jgi:ribonuclease T2